MLLSFFTMYHHVPPVSPDGMFILSAIVDDFSHLHLVDNNEIPYAVTSMDYTLHVICCTVQNIFCARSVDIGCTISKTDADFTLTLPLLQDSICPF